MGVDPLGNSTRSVETYRPPVMTILRRTAMANHALRAPNDDQSLTILRRAANTMIAPITALHLHPVMRTPRRPVTTNPHQPVMKNPHRPAMKNPLNPATRSPPLHILPNDHSMIPMTPMTMTMPRWTGRLTPRRAVREAELRKEQNESAIMKEGRD